MGRAARARAGGSKGSVVRALLAGFLTVVLLAALTGLLGLAISGARDAPTWSKEEWNMKGRTPGLGDFDLGSVPMNGDYVVGRAPLRHVRTLKSPSARARARTWNDLLAIRNTLTYPARLALTTLTMGVAGVLTVGTVLVLLSLMAGRGRGRAGGDAPAAGGRGRGRGGRQPANPNPAGPPGPIPEQPPAWTGVRWPEDSPDDGGNNAFHVDAEGAPQGPPPQRPAEGGGPAHPGAQERGEEDLEAARAPAGRHQEERGPADPGVARARAFPQGSQAASGGVPPYNGQPQVTPTKVAQRKAARAGDAATFAETDEKDARQTATVYLMAALGDGRSVPRVVAHDDTARRLGEELRVGKESAHGAADANTINETRAYLFNRLEAANHARATAQNEEAGAAAFSLTFSPAMDVALCETDRWTSTLQTLRKRRADCMDAHAEADTVELQRTQARTRAAEEECTAALAAQATAAAQAAEERAAAAARQRQQDQRHDEELSFRELERIGAAQAALRAAQERGEAEAAAAAADNAAAAARAAAEEAASRAAHGGAGPRDDRAGGAQQAHGQAQGAPGARERDIPGAGVDYRQGRNAPRAGRDPGLSAPDSALPQNLFGAFGAAEGATPAAGGSGGMQQDEFTASAAKMMRAAAEAMHTLTAAAGARGQGGVLAGTQETTEKSSEEQASAALHKLSAELQRATGMLRDPNGVYKAVLKLCPTLAEDNDPTEVEAMDMLTRLDEHDKKTRGPTFTFPTQAIYIEGWQCLNTAAFNLADHLAPEDQAEGLRMARKMQAALSNVTNIIHNFGYAYLKEHAKKQHNVATNPFHTGDVGKHPFGPGGWADYASLVQIARINRQTGGAEWMGEVAQTTRATATATPRAPTPAPVRPAAPTPTPAAPTPATYTPAPTASTTVRQDSEEALDAHYAALGYTDFSVSPFVPYGCMCAACGRFGHNTLAPRENTTCQASAADWAAKPYIASASRHKGRWGPPK